MNILTRNYMEFVENISLSDEEIQKVRKDAESICGFLKGEFPDTETHVIGSFAKKTQTSPEIDIALSIPSETIRDSLLDEYSPEDWTVDFASSRVNVILAFGGEIYIHPDWVEDATRKDIESIDSSQLSPRQNTRDMIKIIKHWRDINGLEMSSYFIEREVVGFMSDSIHACYSYLLYGIMIMHFFRHLLKYEGEPWAGDVCRSYELVRRAVMSNDKEESIECLTQIFGEEFPDTVYELAYGEYVM